MCVEGAIGMILKWWDTHKKSTCRLQKTTVPLANQGDMDSIPEWGRSYGEGNGNPLQYSCLENPMHRGAWRATVHGVTKELDMT